MDFKSFCLQNDLHKCPEVAKKQSSLIFCLLCVRSKSSDVIQGKALAQDIQYHVQRVGGDGLVGFQPLYL